MKQQRIQHAAALLERTGRLLGNDAHASELLPVHWETLRYLKQANRFSMTSAALTAYLGTTKGTVSQTLKTLAAKGLVQNHINARDRRRNCLSLTGQGRKLLEQDPIRQMTVALAGLQDDSLESLVDGLEQLLSRRLQAQGRQPFGQCHDCVYFASHHADGAPHFCMLLQEQLSAADAEAICYEQVAG